MDAANSSGTSNIAENTAEQGSSESNDLVKIYIDATCCTNKNIAKIINTICTHSRREILKDFCHNGHYPQWHMREKRSVQKDGSNLAFPHKPEVIFFDIVGRFQRKNIDRMFH